MGAPRYAYGFRVTLNPEVLENPVAVPKIGRIFGNAMSDLCQPDVPATFIVDVFA